MTTRGHHGLLLPVAGGGGGGATTWDPATKHAGATLSGGNMSTESSTSDYVSTYATIGKSSGVNAFEIDCVYVAGIGAAVIGIADKTSVAYVLNTWVGNSAAETLGYNAQYGRMYQYMPPMYISGTSAAAGYTTGNRITVKVDQVANTCTFYKNGVVMGTYGITAGKTYFPVASCQLGSKLRLVPSGLAYLPAGATEWG